MNTRKHRTLIGRFLAKNGLQNAFMVVFMVLVAYTGAAGQSLFLTTKIHNDSGSECIVTVYQNGHIIIQERGVKRKSRIKLLFDSEYEICFELPGQIAKVVSVNTQNVPEFMKHEDLDFGLEINLNQANENQRSSKEKTLVARWFFHSDLGEFDYKDDRVPDPSLMTSQDHSL